MSAIVKFEYPRLHQLFLYQLLPYTPQPGQPDSDNPFAPLQK